MALGVCQGNNNNLGLEPESEIYIVAERAYF